MRFIQPSYHAEVMSADPEEVLWKTLESLDPRNVCTRTLAEYNRDGNYYTLGMFNANIAVSVKEEVFAAAESDVDPEGETGALILDGLKSYSRLGALHYLIGAKDMPLTKHLVNPRDLPGGEIYRQGTHMLPLKGVAREFGQDASAFTARGRRLGGVPSEAGDAAVKLFPYPRIPVILVLWLKDEEFPPEASLLFDSSCVLHVPGDIIWGAAMMTIEIFLGKEEK